MNPTAQCVAPWRDLIIKYAKQHKLSPVLVAAVVAQESSGNPFAWRVERGFARRYADGIVALVKRTLWKADDLWSQYPDIFCSSMGLCQVMVPTAIENGFTFRFPSELFDPERNLDIGCAIFARFHARAGGDTRAALLRWNGGSNLRYPDEVLTKMGEIRASGLFNTETPK